MANKYNTSNIRGFVTSPVKPRDILFIWNDDIIAVIYEPVDWFWQTAAWLREKREGKFVAKMDAVNALNKYLNFKNFPAVDAEKDIGIPVYKNSPLDLKLFSAVYKAKRFKYYEDLSQGGRLRLIHKMISWLYRNSNSAAVQNILSGAELDRSIIDAEKDLTEFEKKEIKRNPDIWTDIKNFVFKTVVYIGIAAALYFGIKLFLQYKAIKSDSGKALPSW